MNVEHDRCCGLDVHKRSVTACRLGAPPGGGAGKEVRTFGTMTDRAAGAPDWLQDGGVTHVAMESTGRLLEADLEPAGGAASSCCWSTPGTSRRCPGARPTSRTASGSPTCCGTGCCSASFVPDRAPAGAARVDPLRHRTGPGADGGGQPAAEDAGGGEHQAGLRRHRHPRQVGPGDARGAGRGRRRTRRRWPNWREGGCGRSCPLLERALDRAVRRASAVHGRRAARRTSTASTRRSPGSARRSPQRLARVSDELIGRWTRFPASAASRPRR